MDKRGFSGLSELFQRAREVPRETREAWVRAATAGDAELRSALEGLLAHDVEDDGDSALVRGVRAAVQRAATLGAAAASPPAEIPTVAGFEIVRMVGRGASGAVYEAQQTSPRRRVALKLLFSERTSSGSRRRFDIEANALARMSHPGIARIFSTGSVQVEGVDRPYLALEFVEGRNLLEYAREQALDTPQRCELMARVADAVHDAHRHGVIHRDLKASNILVDADAEPHVLDFGVARLVGGDRSGSALHTRTGQILGTIATMSPEQASGELEKLDRRSDVYSLGCVLYELLSGTAALDLEDCALHEAVRRIREVVPQRLGAHHPGLRGDLEAIVATALQKEPRERYDTAAQLAADLRAFVADEPIRARPPTRWQEWRRRLRRDRRAMLALTGGAAFAVGGFAVAAVFAVRELRRAELDSGRESQRAGELYSFRAERAYAAVADGLLAQIAPTFAALEPAGEPWEFEHLRAASSNARPFAELGSEAWRIREFGPRGTFGVSCSDGRVRRFDAQTGAELAPIATEGQPRYFEVAADGVTLATIAQDARLARYRVSLRRGDSVVREELVEGAPRGWASLHFSPDGALLAWALPDGTLRLWNAHDGATLHTTPLLRDDPRSMAFALDSSRILLAGLREDPRVLVVEARTGRVEAEWDPDGPPIVQVHALDGGRWLTLAEDGAIELRSPGRDGPLARVDTGLKSARLECDAAVGLLYVLGDDGRLRCLDAQDLAPRWSAAIDPRRTRIGALSNDGRTLAIATAWGGVQLVDARTGLHCGTLAGPGGSPYEVRFLEDDRAVVWTADTGSVQLAPVSAAHFALLGPTHSFVYDVAFLDAERWLASLGWDAELVIWDLDSRERVASRKLASRGLHLAVDSAGSQVFAAVLPDVVIAFDARTLCERWRARGPGWAGDLGGLWADPARGRLVAAGRDGRVVALSTQDGSLLAERRDDPAHIVAIAGIPGAETLLTAGTDAVHVRDARTLELRARVPVEGRIQELALDPRAERLAVGLVDGSILLLARDGEGALRVQHTLRTPGRSDENPVYALAFDPSGARLAAGTRDGKVTLWDPVRGSRVLALDAHEPVTPVAGAYHYVHALAFSKSGETLVSASGDRTLRAWSNRTWREQDERLERERRLRERLEPLLRSRLDAGAEAGELARELAVDSALDAEERAWAFGEILRASQAPLPGRSR